MNEQINKPNTPYVLVRTPRINNSLELKVLKNYGEGFDFSEYSFWRMSPTAKQSMEEWVPTSELSLYIRSEK